LSSVVEICNIALTRMGADVIVSIDEPSQQARMCKLHYPLARDVVMKDFPWNFAQRIERLAPETESIPGWNYGYALPNECLKAHRIFNDANMTDQKGTEFLRAGRSIYTSIDQAYLDYTLKIDDPSQFDPNFVDTLAWKLAMELSQTLTGDKAMREQCYTLYQKALEAARGIDTGERYQKLQQSNRYKDVRN